MTTTLADAPCPKTRTRPARAQTLDGVDLPGALAIADRLGHHLAGFQLATMRCDTSGLHRGERVLARRIASQAAVWAPGLHRRIFVAGYDVQHDEVTR